MINTVNICGIPYRVTEHQPNFDATTKHFGQVDFLGAEIRINHNMAEVIKTETLVHEIVHAILVHIGRSELSEDEVLVQSLANAINQTFKVKED